MLKLRPRLQIQFNLSEDSAGYPQRLVPTVLCCKTIFEWKCFWHQLLKACSFKRRHSRFSKQIWFLKIFSEHYLSKYLCRRHAWVVETPSKIFDRYDFQKYCQWISQPNLRYSLTMCMVTIWNLGWLNSELLLSLLIFVLNGKKLHFAPFIYMCVYLSVYRNCNKWDYVQ